MLYKQGRILFSDKKVYLECKILPKVWEKTRTIKVGKRVLEVEAGDVLMYGDGTGVVNLRCFTYLGLSILKVGLYDVAKNQICEFNINPKKLVSTEKEQLFHFMNRKIWIN